MSNAFVEVVYALPEKQFVLRVVWHNALTIAAAIEQARRALGGEVQSDADRLACSAIPWHTARVGVFGEVRSRESLLQSGDRVEIYRDLLVDPKLARRERVSTARKQR